VTNDTPAREPVFNVPGVVLALLVLIVAVHGGLSMLSEPDEQRAVLALSFIPDRYSAKGLIWPGGTMAAFTSPVTHMLVHGDLSHLMLNAASLLAFGGVVARRQSPGAFLLFTLLTGLAGALAFLVLNPGLQAPMVGASGAIAGMMAAALRLLFSAVDCAPPGLAGEFIRNEPQRIVRMDLATTIRDSRIRSAALVWLAVNVLAAYGLGTPGQSGGIAWEAHIGGFFAGLLGLGLFDRSNPGKTHIPEAGFEPKQPSS
jgi:membrane associated rhomboid family serine protease